jgi:hypothetical protein
LVPGETMLVLECAPAAYINYAVNEAEKGASIKILHVSSVGRFGRMWLSGSEAEIVSARNAAVKALEELVEERRPDGSAAIGDFGGARTSGAGRRPPRRRHHDQGIARIADGSYRQGAGKELFPQRARGAEPRLIH